MAFKPNPQVLAALSAALSALAIARLLGQDRLRVALARTSKVAWAITHPRTFLRVVTELARPWVQPVVRADPRVLVKYVGRYLGVALSPRERASILVSHYAFLRGRVNENFFRRVVAGRVELWRQDGPEYGYRICLTYSGQHHAEGDLSLVFLRDDLVIYTLSFTIGPGGIAGLARGHAMYIGRIQGKGNELQVISNATKDCMDISPAALLLTAAESIAIVLELGHIVGVSADMQVSAVADSRPEGLIHGYDEFWTALGGSRLARGMFHLSVPLREKPIKIIKSNHRSRVLRKRAFKTRTREQICSEFRTIAFLSPGK